MGGNPGLSISGATVRQPGSELGEEGQGRGGCWELSSGLTAQCPLALPD